MADSGRIRPPSADHGMNRESDARKEPETSQEEPNMHQKELMARKESDARPRESDGSHKAPTAQRDPDVLRHKESDARHKEPIPMALLAEAAKVLIDYACEQQRRYDSACTLLDMLAVVPLEELLALEARRDALADEIGMLEARLIALKAEAGKAEAKAKA